MKFIAFTHSQRLSGLCGVFLRSAAPKTSRHLHVLSRPRCFIPKGPHPAAAAVSMFRGDVPPRSYPRPRHFATSDTGSSSSFFSRFSSPMDWWRDRQSKKEEAKYKERVLQMSEKETFRVADMIQELDEINKSWMAKMPLLSSTKETQTAKHMFKVISAVGSVAGTDATLDKLESLSRKEKLQIAIAAESSLEDVNTIIQQFGVMDIMHKVVRKRKLEGRPIPLTQEGMQAAMQTDAITLLSKAQKEKAAKEHLRRMRLSKR